MSMSKQDSSGNLWRMQYQMQLVTCRYGLTHVDTLLQEVDVRSLA